MSSSLRRTWSGTKDILCFFISGRLVRLCEIIRQSHTVRLTRTSFKYQRQIILTAFLRKLI